MSRDLSPTPRSERSPTDPFRHQQYPASLDYDHLDSLLAPVATTIGGIDDGGFGLGYNADLPIFSLSEDRHGEYSGGGGGRNLTAPLDVVGKLSFDGDGGYVSSSAGSEHGGSTTTSPRVSSHGGRSSNGPSISDEMFVRPPLNATTALVPAGRGGLGGSGSCHPSVDNNESVVPHIKHQGAVVGPEALLHQHRSGSRKEGQVVTACTSTEAAAEAKSSNQKKGVRNNTMRRDALGPRVPPQYLRKLRDDPPLELSTTDLRPNLNQAPPNWLQSDERHSVAHHATHQWTPTESSEGLLDLIATLEAAGHSLRNPTANGNILQGAGEEGLDDGAFALPDLDYGEDLPGESPNVSRSFFSHNDFLLNPSSDKPAHQVPPVPNEHPGQTSKQGGEGGLGRISKLAASSRGGKKKLSKKKLEEGDVDVTSSEAEPPEPELQLQKGPPDVVCSAEDLKRLLLAPHNDHPFALVVHRVGPSLVLEGTGSMATLHDTKRVKDTRRRALYSKLLYYAIGATQEEGTCDVSSSVSAGGGGGGGQNSSQGSPFLVGSDSKFRRSLQWSFDDLRLLLGVNTPILKRKETQQEMTLQVHDEKEYVTKEESLEYWLDNIMSAMDKVAICYHRDGVVQGYQVVNTAELPKLSSVEHFEPLAIQKQASSVLKWLRAVCTKQCGSYVVVKDGESRSLKVYDLSTLQKVQETAAAAVSPTTTTTTPAAATGDATTSGLGAAAAPQQSSPDVSDFPIVREVVDSSRSVPRATTLSHTGGSVSPHPGSPTSAYAIDEGREILLSSSPASPDEDDQTRSSSHRLFPGTTTTAEVGATTKDDENVLPMFQYPMAMMCYRMSQCLPNSDAEGQRLRLKCLDLLRKTVGFQDTEHAAIVSSMYVQCMTHYHSYSPLPDAEESCLSFAQGAVEALQKVFKHLQSVEDLERTSPSTAAGSDVSSAGSQEAKLQKAKQWTHAMNEAKWRSCIVLRCLCAVGMQHLKARPVDYALIVQILSLAQCLVVVRRREIPFGFISAPPSAPATPGVSTSSDGAADDLLTPLEFERDRYKQDLLACLAGIEVMIGDLNHFLLLDSDPSTRPPPPSTSASSSPPLTTHTIAPIPTAAAGGGKKGGGGGGAKSKNKGNSGATTAVPPSTKPTSVGPAVYYIPPRRVMSVALRNCRMTGPLAASVLDCTSAGEDGIPSHLNYLDRLEPLNEDPDTLLDRGVDAYQRALVHHNQLHKPPREVRRKLGGLYSQLAARKSNEMSKRFGLVSRGDRAEVSKEERQTALKHCMQLYKTAASSFKFAGDGTNYLMMANNVARMLTRTAETHFEGTAVYSAEEVCCLEAAAKELSSALSLVLATEVSGTTSGQCFFSAPSAEIRAGVYATKANIHQAIVTRAFATQADYLRKLNTPGNGDTPLLSISNTNAVEVENVKKLLGSIASNLAVAQKCFKLSKISSNVMEASFKVLDGERHLMHIRLLSKLRGNGAKEEKGRSTIEKKSNNKKELKKKDDDTVDVESHAKQAIARFRQAFPVLAPQLQDISTRCVSGQIEAYLALYAELDAEDELGVIHTNGGAHREQKNDLMAKGLTLLCDFKPWFDFQVAPPAGAPPLTMGAVESARTLGDRWTSVLVRFIKTLPTGPQAEEVVNRLKTILRAVMQKTTGNKKSVEVVYSQLLSVEQKAQHRELVLTLQTATGDVMELFGSNRTRATR